MTTSELLQTLIRIPSVNPDGGPGSAETGEKACAEFLAGFLTEIGAEATLEDVFPGRPNVVGRFPSDRDGKPKLLFAPHTDTVSVAGMTIEPFSGEMRDGKIWGRGASDTKGPMAAMLSALSGCREIIPHLSHEIWFAGLMSEETDQHGAKALAEKSRFDFVVVGEPTDLQIVRTHKGSARLTLRARGKAVHSSTPDKGSNAIVLMMDALTDLRAEIGRSFAGLHDDVLGSPTFSIGTFHGGSKVNIVPDFCEAQLDMRTIPGQDVRPMLDAFAARFPGIELGARHSGSLKTDAAHPMIKKLEACGAQCTGAPWFCDAAIFAGKGIPAVAIGPGSISQAHTADEWIAVAELDRGARFFTEFLKSLSTP